MGPLAYAHTWEVYCITDDMIVYVKIYLIVQKYNL